MLNQDFKVNAEMSSIVTTCTLQMMHINNFHVNYENIFGEFLTL